MSSESKTIINGNSKGNPDKDANRDPISGAPGAHPVGTGVGAGLGGVAAGAAVGTVAGPVGTVVGAAVGAIVGGLAGKGVAEAIDPTVEAAYWRENFKTRPYAKDSTGYDDYAPAYGYGVSAYGKNPGRSFDEAESDLQKDWPRARGQSKLNWDAARPATKDAWERVGNRS